MASLYYEKDGDLGELSGRRVAVVGYGNQGRSWALNLRDSGANVTVCVRADATCEQARSDGFAPQEITAANQADVLCVLIPDDVIGSLGLAPRADALTVLASG